jgi:hypothetical protein
MAGKALMMGRDEPAELPTAVKEVMAIFGHQGVVRHLHPRERGLTAGEYLNCFAAVS